MLTLEIPFQLHMMEFCNFATLAAQTDGQIRHGTAADARGLFESV